MSARKNALAAQGDAIASRMRERRLALRLSLAQVAARAGLKAPSFLHHIERGERLPSEGVAVRLAFALEDDAELYRAWVCARAGAPLDQALAAARRLESALAVAAPAPALLLRVPRLEWGVDPGDPATPAPPLEVLRFDPQALPPEAWLRPFAYSLPRDTTPAAPLLAGDLVLFTRNAWPVHSQALYLVRAPEGALLGRLAWRDGTLWLASEAGEEIRSLAPSGLPPRDLLGRLAAVIRAGPRPGGP